MKGEARQILAEIHSWFTEGFDTVDLREAKALLKELGAKGFSQLFYGTLILTLSRKAAGEGRVCLSLRLHKLLLLLNQLRSPSCYAAFFTPATFRCHWWLWPRMRLLTNPEMFLVS